MCKIRAPAGLMSDEELRLGNVKGLSIVPIAFLILPGIGSSLPTLVKKTFVTHSTDSNANLVWKHSHRKMGDHQQEEEEEESFEKFSRVGGGEVIQPFHPGSLDLMDPQTGFPHAGQAALELLTSGDPPALVSQSAGITGVSHRARPEERIYYGNWLT
ncbi:hypothetical protein AAY473_006692 [Plecturocebus cupreus]